MSVRLFSYGTLQMPRVQQALFGRLVPMEEAVLLGYEAVPIEIDDPDVIEFSGSTTHRALVPAAADAAIPGKVLTIEQSDWPALDTYEDMRPAGAFRAGTRKISKIQVAWFSRCVRTFPGLLWLSPISPLIEGDQACKKA